ncbi:MAG: TetR family transcriptional regulator [Myxococcota bacterium]
MSPVKQPADALADVRRPDEILPGRVAPAQLRQGRRPTAQSRRTRERVIEAAALCIAEEGFAAAHTNRIAERAGVSWGVLQYHFGDKAGLLSAVLERGVLALERGFSDIEIDGGSLRERLSAVVDAGWQLFRSPLARAGNEILVNARAELAGGSETPIDLERMTRNLVHQARAALREAVGDARRARALEGVLLAALRGFNLALLLAPTDYDFANERRTLVEMMALHVEAHSRS